MDHFFYLRMTHKDFQLVCSKKQLSSGSTVSSHDYVNEVSLVRTRFSESRYIFIGKKRLVFLLKIVYIISENGYNMGTDYMINFSLKNQISIKKGIKKKYTILRRFNTFI